MKPRVTSIQVMKACWKKGYNYKKYVQVTGMLRIRRQSSNCYAYHCLIWGNLL